MKNFLSIILALAMLIAPVGTVLSFADGEKDAYVVGGVTAIGLEKITMLAIVGDKGDFEIKLDFHSRRRCLLGKYMLSRDNSAYEDFERLISDNHVRETIKLLNCERAILVLKPFTYTIKASFEDRCGNVVRTEVYPYKKFSR